MSRVIRNKAIVRHLIKVGVIANQRDLGNKMGYSNESSFSQVLNGRVAEPKDFIPKLKSIMPDLNVNWLLYGEGSMLNVQAAKMSPYPVEDAEIVGEQSSIQPSDGAVDVIATPPIIPPEIASSPGIDTLKWVRENHESTEKLRIIDVLGATNIVYEVRGNSMYPTYASGELILLREVPPYDPQIENDKCYAIDVKGVGLMIRRLVDNLDSWICKGDAIGTTPMVVPKDKIIRIFTILADISLNERSLVPLPNSQDAHKREEQVERLLTMHEEAMAEIRLQNERIAEERHRQDAERREQLARQDELIKIITRQYNN